MTLTHSGIVNASEKDYLDALEKLGKRYNGAIVKGSLLLNRCYSAFPSKDRLYIYDKDTSTLKLKSFEELDKSVCEYLVVRATDDDDSTGLYVLYNAIVNNDKRIIEFDIKLRAKSYGEAIHIIKRDLIATTVEYMLADVVCIETDEEEQGVYNSGEGFDDFDEYLDLI